MGIYLAEQVRVFLLSILLGAALGLFYDMFRISRIAFCTAPAVIFAEDILFFLVCGIATFFFGLTVIDGMLRVFLLTGELLGAVLYYFTVGRFVMGVAKKIIEIVKSILRFIFRWILRPVWLLVYHIIALILKPFIFLAQISKKIFQNIKFRLKVRRKVLYNQFNKHFFRNCSIKKQRGHKNEKTQRSGNA